MDFRPPGPDAGDTMSTETQATPGAAGADDQGRDTLSVTDNRTGKTYEIDLTTANADKLRGLLDPYAKSGRRTGGRSAGGRGKGRVVTGGNKDTAEIRKWAKEIGGNRKERKRVKRKEEKMSRKVGENKCYKYKYTNTYLSLTKYYITSKGEEAILEFVIRWRQNFLTTLRPTHMPLHWDVRHDFAVSSPSSSSQ